MQFDIKKNDKTYYLHGVIGIILYENNLKDCYIKMNEIVKDLSLVLVDYHKEDVGRLANPPGADPYGGTYDLFLFKKINQIKVIEFRFHATIGQKKVIFQIL